MARLPLLLLGVISLQVFLPILSLSLPDELSPTSGKLTPGAVNTSSRLKRQSDDRLFQGGPRQCPQNLPAPPIPIQGEGRPRTAIPLNRLPPAPAFNGRVSAPFRILNPDGFNLPSQDPGGRMLGEGGTPLSRHHIIPARTLGNFFNLVIRNEIIFQGHAGGSRHFRFGEFLERLTQEAIFDFRRLPTSQNDAHDSASEIAYVLVGNQSLPRHTETLYHMFQWFPPNIFVGPDPNYRNNDPQDHFDEEAACAVGGGYGVIILELFRALNWIMVNYNEHADALTDEQHTGMVTCAVDILDRLLNYQRRVYHYNREQWRAVDRKWTAICPPTSHFRRERREIGATFATKNKSSIPDSCCFVPVKLWDLKSRNLAIAKMVFERAKNSGGFTEKDYASWKEWYHNSPWISNFSWGIFGDGVKMAGFGLLKKVWGSFGYVFRDGSVSVGIVGRDTLHGDDNWKTIKGSDWLLDKDESEGYAGQMFFDRNGRPVAIVITKKIFGEFGSGYSFIYNDGKWEYESTDDWDGRRFGGRTESLDSTAPRFLR
ncbi:uncharacterized protein LOC117648579 [Thrips palmi]|uniref:Uncharacterized protein LOC117648579 n=1 Tax=Thrips palmi TaxID=161013 RepID=A0A6P8Z9A6_THRPL|nr:uncharacterized protein LOC117648579 [Thrips palmi]